MSVVKIQQQLTDLFTEGKGLLAGQREQVSTQTVSEDSSEERDQTQPKAWLHCACRQCRMEPEPESSNGKRGSGRKGREEGKESPGRTMNVIKRHEDVLSKRPGCEKKLHNVEGAERWRIRPRKYAGATRWKALHVMLTA